MNKGKMIRLTDGTVIEAKMNFGTIYYLDQIGGSKLGRRIDKLEKIGKLKAIVTQNIDGLHTKAGSTNVLELHGTIYKNHCIKCHKFYDAEYVFNSKDIPLCECGSLIKPDVVLYGEMLDEYTLNRSIEVLSKCDTLIVDPPRAGLDKHTKSVINNSNIKKVIYVSCDPMTLVRDLKDLDMYNLEKISIVDMFPQTCHVESVCVLERRR